MKYITRHFLFPLIRTRAIRYRNMQFWSQPNGINHKNSEFPPNGISFRWKISAEKSELQRNSMRCAFLWLIVKICHWHEPSFVRSLKTKWANICAISSLPTNKLMSDCWICFIIIYMTSIDCHLPILRINTLWSAISIFIFGNSHEISPICLIKQMSIEDVSEVFFFLVCWWLRRDREKENEMNWRENVEIKPDKWLLE